MTPLESNEQDFVGIFFSSFLTKNDDFVERLDMDVNTDYMDDVSQGNSDMDVHMSMRESNDLDYSNVDIDIFKDIFEVGHTQNYMTFDDIFEDLEYLVKG